MVRMSLRDRWLLGLLEMHERRGSRYGPLFAGLHDVPASIVLGLASLLIGGMLTAMSLHGLKGIAVSPWTEVDAGAAIRDVVPGASPGVATLSGDGLALGLLGTLLATGGLALSVYVRHQISLTCLAGFILCAGPYVILLVEALLAGG